MLKVYNPADGSLVGEVPDASAVEIDSAIQAIHGAFPAWSQKLARERAQILRRWHDLVKADKEVFAALMTRENGKCLSESRGEVDYGLEFIEWYGEEAKRIYGDTIPAHMENASVLVVKEAIGPVAAITPWNFPFAMITRKVAPALAAGCSVVIKPAEDTPLTAIKLMEYAHRAGVPEDVYRTVSGDAKMIGEHFTRDPRIQKLSFTGSTPVGRLLASQCADTVKKLTMELGGNAPFIVFDDADIDAAIKGLVYAKLRNSGQVCIAPNRIYLQSGIAPRFTERLRDAVSKIEVGDGMRDDFVIGPLINRKGFEKVSALVADAVGHGASIVLGGKPHAKGGLFYEPTILTDVKDDSSISRTEIFGPVFALYTFDREEEAIRRANATEFGLVSYAYTNDYGRAFRLSKQLQAGMVILNSGAVGTASAPFGGIKQSGYGREGSYYGIEEYVQVKYVLMAGQG